MISNSTQHINIKNPVNTTYIRGDETTDGSQRIALDEFGKPQFQLRVLGVWGIEQLTFSNASFVIDATTKTIALDVEGEFVRVGVI